MALNQQGYEWFLSHKTRIDSLLLSRGLMLGLDPSLVILETSTMKPAISYLQVVLVLAAVLAFAVSWACLFFFGKATTLHHCWQICLPLQLRIRRATAEALGTSAEFRRSSLKTLALLSLWLHPSVSSGTTYRARHRRYSCTPLATIVRSTRVNIILHKKSFQRRIQSRRLHCSGQDPRMFEDPVGYISCSAPRSAWRVA